MTKPTHDLHLLRHFEATLETAILRGDNITRVIDSLIRACCLKGILLRELEAGILRERQGRL